jgi:hypothetical protein
MNKLDFWLIDDPREKALRDALCRAIARCSDRTDRRTDGAGVRQFTAVSTGA